MLGSSWKVKLAGIGVIVLIALGPVLQSYIPLHGLNWETLCTSIAGIIGGGGLLLAKQYNVHGGDVDTGVRPSPVPVVIAPPIPGPVVVPKMQAATPEAVVPNFTVKLFQLPDKTWTFRVDFSDPVNASLIGNKIIENAVFQLTQAIDSVLSSPSSKQ